MWIPSRENPSLVLSSPREQRDTEPNSVLYPGIQSIQGERSWTQASGELVAMEKNPLIPKRVGPGRTLQVGT